MQFIGLLSVEEGFNLGGKAVIDFGRVCAVNGSVLGCRVIMVHPMASI